MLQLLQKAKTDRKEQIDKWTNEVEGMLLMLEGKKLVKAEVSSCCNTGSIRDDPYWTSRKNSLELIELSSVNKVSLV